MKNIFRQIASVAEEVFLGYEIEVLTFSQAGEDFIVRNYFYDRLSRGDKGFFVDIGAFHPYRHSNTYYLYRAGWRGINIDARPGSMELFEKLRPEDTNLEIAIGLAREGRPITILVRTPDLIRYQMSILKSLALAML